MSDYVPTKHERESAEAREALWNALGRRPDELFAIASALTAAEERGRLRGVEEAATLCDRRANGHVEGSAAGLEARKCANAVRDLAPRDSGKEQT